MAGKVARKVDWKSIILRTGGVTSSKNPIHHDLWEFPQLISDNSTKYDTGVRRTNQKTVRAGTNLRSWKKWLPDVGMSRGVNSGLYINVVKPREILSIKKRLNTVLRPLSTPRQDVTLWQKMPGRRKKMFFSSVIKFLDVVKYENVCFRMSLNTTRSNGSRLLGEF